MGGIDHFCIQLWWKLYVQRAVSCKFVLSSSKFALSCSSSYNQLVNITGHFGKFGQLFIDLYVEQLKGAEH